MGTAATTATHTLRALLVASLLLSAWASPTFAEVRIYVFDTPISGDVVETTLLLADAPEGGAVDITLVIPPGEGDLLGFFGNVADDAIVASMAVEDPHGLITQWQFQANKVWKVGGGNVMAPVKNWDFGLRIDQQGSAGGAVEEAAFRLTGPGLRVEDLASAANQGWVFGVRIQSTNGPEGSSKLGLGEGVPPQVVSPTIAIATPADGALLGETPVTVTGSVTGTDPGVEVNGVAATVSEGGFSAVIPLQEGANAIVATASNAAGSASDEIAVTLDTTPPVVTISEPAEGAVVSQSVIAVAGTVVDASPIVALEIDGQPLPPGDSFDTTHTLAEGPNPIVVTATDAAGNQGSAEVGVTLVLTAPLTIDIDVPPNGALVSSERLNVAGSVSDPAAQVSVNGVSATVTGSAYAAPAVPLVPGENTLLATATRGEETATASVTVTHNVPPQVLIVTPPDGSLFREGQVDVEGLVDDPTAHVDVNGVVASVGSAGRFLARDVPLELGENRLTARAVDPLGAQGSDAVTVTRDDDAPGQLEIVIVDPQRRPFTHPSMPLPAVPVTAADLESFKASLVRLGLFPEQFDTPVREVGVSIAPDSDPPPDAPDRVLHVYVFTGGGQVGEALRLPAAEAFGELGQVQGPLRDVSELRDDLESVGLDVGIADQILPDAFEANGFRRVTVPMDAGYGYGGGGVPQ